MKVLLSIILFLIIAPVAYAQTVPTPTTNPYPLTIGAKWPDGTIVLVCVPNGDGTYKSELLPNETGSSGYVGASTTPGAIVYTQPGSSCPSNSVTPTTAPTPTNTPITVIPTDTPQVVGSSAITQPTGVPSVGPTSLPTATPTPVILQPDPTVAPSDNFQSGLITMILAELKSLLKGGIYG